MKRTVIDANDVKQLIPSLKSDKLINAVLHFLKVDKCNELHSACCDMRGADFTDGILNGVGAKLEIINEDRLKNLPEGAFVVLSNHPYGAIDGISIISIFARYRPEFKVMVNKILTYIGAMKDNFIAVEPHSSSEEAKATSMNGIRTAMRHVRDGHPIGFFPAGAVSNLKSDFSTCDRDWQPNIIRLVKQFKKPVIPVYYYGRNSLTFYLLRSITYILSSLRLPTEVFNKKGKTLRVVIGETIMPEEYAHIDDVEELAKFFKAKTYALKGS